MIAGMVCLLGDILKRSSVSSQIPLYIFIVVKVEVRLVEGVRLRILEVGVVVPLISAQ